MSIFDAYDHEFSSLSQEISRNVSELKAYTSANDKTDSLIKMIDGLLKNSTDVIKQMELEVNSIAIILYPVSSILLKYHPENLV